MEILELEKKSLVELRSIAKDFDIPRASYLKKENLMIRIRQAEAEKEGLEVRGGILEIMNEGIGLFAHDSQLGRKMYMSHRLNFAQDLPMAIW